MTQLGLKFVRPVRAIPCDICGRKALTDADRFVHDGCQGKPQPCDCGAPSMPAPNCTFCKGSGRVGGDLARGDVCYLCPPGPCVTCCARALLGRVRSARFETVTNSDSLTRS